MNNPLEQILMQQKRDALQKKVGYVGPMVGDVPREFGEGEHFVQLAYITPDEANILKELDLYGSNPPHTGPEIENIPNYNDFGEGSMNASGSQMSAAERGDVKGSGLSASDVAGIQAGAQAAAAGQEASQNFMDNQNTSTTSTTETTTTEDDTKTDPTFTDKVKNYFKNKFSLPGILGTAIGYGLFGPFGGYLGGAIGGTYGDDDPSNNFGANMMDAISTDLQGLGSLFGPAEDLGPDRGGNNQGPILPIDPVEDPVEEIIEDDDTDGTGSGSSTLNLNPDFATFGYNPITNSFGFRP